VIGYVQRQSKSIDIRSSQNTGSGSRKAELRHEVNPEMGETAQGWRSGMTTLCISKSQLQVWAVVRR